MGLHPRIQGPGHEEVANPEQNLGAVERLGEEVLGPGGQYPLLHLGCGVGGQDEDRQELFLTQGGPQRLHHDEPVDGVHAQIEEHEIGAQLKAPWYHLRPHSRTIGRDGG